MSIQGASMVKGIDVSGHQTNIDWDKVHNEGNVDVAYLKASEGKDFTESSYASKRKEANAAGVVVGAYDFARPGSKSSNPATDARLEAEHFLSVAKIRDGDLAPVLDLEDAGSLGPEALSTWTKTWIDVVREATGTKPVVYTSPGFWESKIADDGDIADSSHLWVAHWGVSEPDVPGSYDDWQVWQKTSDGQIPGISGRVDVDTFSNPEELLVGGSPEQSSTQQSAPSRPRRRSGQSRSTSASTPVAQSPVAQSPVQQAPPVTASCTPVPPPAPAPTPAPVAAPVTASCTPEPPPPADPTAVPADPAQAYSATAACCCCCQG